MDQALRHKIKRLVREILSDMTEQSIPEPRAVKSGPRALIVFHNGGFQLENALAQVRLIGEFTRKLCVFRAASACSLVSVHEVKNKCAVKCFLDTAVLADLEKVIDHSDIIILPTFGFPTATKVAGLLCDDIESGVIFSAMMKGKKILAAEDGYADPDSTVNPYLQKEIDDIIDKLKKFGMLFCPTDKLSSRCQQLTAAKQEHHAVMPEQNHLNAVKLVTAKDVNRAAEEKQHSIMLAQNGMVTPLARDLAKEYAVEIIKVTD
jgi:hypothetical protein